MIRILLTLFSFFSLWTLAFGQHPIPAKIQPQTTQDLNRGLLVPCTDNDAGTIANFGPFVGQSNDVTPDTIFLCLGDTLFIDHAGDAVLNGDPDPLTPPGVGYAFYTCPPTVDGPDVATIQNDPCLALTPPPTPPSPYYIYPSPGLDGDAPFFNQGQLQTFFAGGDPVHLWFAPITFDAFNGVNAEYEGAPSGSCVSVSVDESFSVVYLNEITITDIDNTSPTGCLGTFRVQGGLPEWQNLGFYSSINIYLQSDPTVHGQVLNGAANHDDIVEFYVPLPGTYVIEVSDGVSCGGSATVDMSGCQDVTFVLPLTNAMPGQNICLDFTVENFVMVGSMQYTITWDPNILSYTGPQGFNPLMPELDVSSFFQVMPGHLGLQWNSFDFNNGVTLNDGETIFELCFDVIGDLGEYTDFNITGSPIPIEVGDVSPLPQQYGVNIRQGRVNITNDPFFVSIAQDSLTCPSFDDGSFTVTVDQAAEPYRFFWNTVPVSGPNNGPVIIPDDGGSATVSNLPAGTYQITVTDASVPAQQVIDTIEVLAGPDIGSSLVFTSPSCFGESDGTVEVQLTLDGVVIDEPGSEFTFQWVSTPLDTNILINQASGPYSVTVTDPSGCTSISSGSMSQPAQLRILANNTFITNASCTGVNDGSIDVTATGGTTADGNYTYAWDSGLGTIVGSNSSVMAGPGMYCVTVTDDNGCSFENCYTVGAVKTLSINEVITDVSCNGLADGEITIVGNTTGAPADEPYSFAWSPNATSPVNTANTSEITGLIAGTYSVTMTDASPAGCQAVDTFMVEQPEVLVSSVLDQVNETCVVGNDGQVTIGVTGGTYPYTYTWSHDGMLNDSIATGLSQGAYTVDIEDANGCTDQEMIDILAPTPPMITQLNDDSVSCPGDTDGELTVVATAGGAPIASYTWLDGNGDLVGTTPTITNLGAGQYTVTILADDACSTVDTAFVLAPDPITLDSVGLRLPDCPGFSNGQITLFVSGGTQPYAFTWSTNPGVPGTQNPLPALEAGLYGVTISDASGCQPVVEIIELPDPPSITGAFSNVQDTSCPDSASCDGEATFTAGYDDGTTGDFFFTWSSGETANTTDVSTATQLCQGMQMVTVSDGVCGAEFEVTIGAPEPITVDVETENVSCNGFTDGTITLAPAGGTPGYTYFWTHSGEVTASVADLAAGSYTAVITDGNSCTREQTVQVNEPAPLVATIDPALTTPTVTCNGDMDGVIGLTVTGGNSTAPYTFVWSNGATTSTNANLAAGNYSATVTDVKACETEIMYTIGEPEPISFSLQPVQPPLCFGDATFVAIDTAFGGAGNDFVEFTYMVDNNGLSFPVSQPATIFAGDHIITIEDVNGCQEDLPLSIPQPPIVTVTLPNEVVVELGDSTTQLMPQVTPSGVYSYLWTPSEFLSSDTVRNPFVFPETSLEYTLVVTNENGCTAQGMVFVELDANRNVYIPNIFSPNGDGRNDEFRVFACRGVRSVNYVRLFDRWGGIVYENDDLDPNCLDGIKLWDGQKNGRPLNPGVYV
ncbi:MAG: gliding motility-associated C-terminal domain-containing protein, partial [Lewinella sp.]|nr:gliding motility-associated C-terminal domain-containing protein [Lewinella sp.]